MIRWAVVFSAFWLLSSPCSAYPAWDQWKAGREARAGNWTQATAMYEKLVQEHPDSARACLNLGLCYYRQGQFDKAEAQFKKARDLDNGAQFKGQTFYDLGNTLFRKNKLEDALEAYKGALRWNDLDDDARYNVQVILDKLKKNKPKDKDKDKDKDKNKNKDKNKDKDKKDKKKDKNQKNKDKKDDKKKDKNQQKPPGKDGKQPPPKGEPPKQDPGKNGQQPPPPQDPSKMSKQDAERLLKYFQNREKKNLANQMKKGRPVQAVGGDDW